MILKIAKHYGKITSAEVRVCISEVKRDTSPGPDLLTLAYLKFLTFNETAAILNKWWGNNTPDSVKQC